MVQSCPLTCMHLTVFCGLWYCSLLKFMGGNTKNHFYFFGVNTRFIRCAEFWDGGFQNSPPMDVTCVCGITRTVSLWTAKNIMSWHLPFWERDPLQKNGNSQRVMHHASRSVKMRSQNESVAVRWGSAGGQIQVRPSQKFCISR